MRVLAREGFAQDTTWTMIGRMDSRLKYEVFIYSRGGGVTPPEGSCFSDGGFAKNEVF